MGQSSRSGAGLTPAQFHKVMSSVAEAGRRMTYNQILDLADRLHELIRHRAYRGPPLGVRELGASIGEHPHGPC